MQTEEKRENIEEKKEERMEMPVSGALERGAGKAPVSGAEISVHDTENGHPSEDVYILAIESSCDETAASVVKNGRTVLSNIISSQIDLHTLFGGVVPGSKVHKGEALFPRIDVAKELELLEAEKQAALEHAKEIAEKDAKKEEIPAPSDEEKTVFTQRDLIQFEDFEKIQLVVAKVLKCEKVPKADKLLMSTLKVGDTERVVVSGIAKFYTPEEMVGKKVVLLANLAPRKIRGVESHGMLLCAANADDSKLSLLTVDSDMEDGCEIG